MTALLISCDFSSPCKTQPKGKLLYSTGGALQINHLNRTRCSFFSLSYIYSQVFRHLLSFTNPSGCDVPISTPSFPISHNCVHSFHTGARLTPAFTTIPPLTLSCDIERPLDIHNHYQIQASRRLRSSGTVLLSRLRIMPGADATLSCRFFALTFCHRSQLGRCRMFAPKISRPAYVVLL